MSLVKLGDLYFSAISQEVLTFENVPSNYPLENGTEVTDFVQTQPLNLSITGVIVGEDAAEKYSVLRNYLLQKPLLKYIGRIIMDNCMVINFSRDVDSTIANGFNFNMTLQEMKFAQVEIVTINVRNLKIPDIEKPKASKKKKKGRKSKEDTKIIKVDNAKLNDRIKELTGY